ncbi:MAG: phosphomannomutase/phosphoglucomutase [Deltaproteobacteria bacterium]|nr:MAG: phosphomannomutase/phosphoglucomutase [Deltaproteobacteria bacterium]
MNPEIFREYDIRGITGEDITGEDVVLIGKAIGSFLATRGHTRLSVGRDCRVTSYHYSEKIIQGLLSVGCDVIDIGICPTPVFYFSIQHLATQGGVMVTASHNPPEYNGFKICLDLDSVHGEDIQTIRKMIEKQQYAEGGGKRVFQDVIAAYHDYVVSNIHIYRTMRVGIDAGNGTGGVVAVPILRKLNCEVHELYCDMDGTFPNHEADPTVAKNMKDLISLVKEKGLDLGIGYDGDSDRIGVVDKTGNLIYGDQLMILFSREILSRKPGATFISEVKCSKTMYDDIRKHGGNAIMWKTGHSLIKKKMKEEKAELAGEMSGHIFFADRYFGYDDAIYASCRLLEILSDTGKTISELLADVPKTFNTPEIRVDCPDSIKFQVVRKVTQIFREKYDVIDIDGVRILFDDGWGLVRASNTQPALVLRFEAMTRERIAEIRALVEHTLEDVKKGF